jgi:dTDP-4-dehydrorhamnose 3,5-epimerase
VRFIETELAGAFIIEPEQLADERGFFARISCARELESRGLVSNFVQTSIAYNHKRGTLRGMHFQVAPYEEVKTVRCTMGSIFDVIIDLRPDSPTYLSWMSVVLSAENRHMLYVPEGFAHGYQTLEDNSEVFYEMSQFYVPESARGIRWDDPSIAIRWPDAEERVISDKDRKLPFRTALSAGDLGAKARHG